MLGWSQSKKSATKYINLYIEPVKDIVLSPLGDHQKYAIEEIISRSSLAIAFAPGTGKSRIVLSAIAELFSEEGERYLILTPNSLVEQTMEEVSKWLSPELGEKFLPLYENTTIKQRVALLLHDKAWRVAVLSHESLSHKLIADAVAKLRFKAAFLDEASRFRNYSKRSKALLRIRAEKRVILSGTMIVKAPSDIWYVFKWLDPNWCGITRRDIFNAEYCILGGYTGTEPLDVRPERVEQLNNVLNKYRITCTLSDVRDMPRRTSSVRYVDMPPQQRRYYNELRDTLRLEIERLDDRNFELSVNSYIGRLQRLQEISAGFARNIEGRVEEFRGGKAAELCEILRDEIPSIVWTWWRPETEAVHRLLSNSGIKSVRLDQGGREVFLSGEASVLVANIASGGYGLNLDRAERMIYHSLYWGADVMAQSLDRNWRLTTEVDKYVIYLVCRDTIDEYVLAKLQGRAGMSGKLSRSEALELLA